MEWDETPFDYSWCWSRIPDVFGSMWFWMFHGSRVCKVQSRILSFLCQYDAMFQWHGDIRVFVSVFSKLQFNCGGHESVFSSSDSIQLCSTLWALYRQKVSVFPFVLCWFPIVGGGRFLPNPSFFLILHLQRKNSWIGPSIFEETSRLFVPLPSKTVKVSLECRSWFRGPNTVLLWFWQLLQVRDFSVHSQDLTGQHPCTQTCNKHKCIHGGDFESWVILRRCSFHSSPWNLATSIAGRQQVHFPCILHQLAQLQNHSRGLRRQKGKAEDDNLEESLTCKASAFSLVPFMKKHLPVIRKINKQMTVESVALICENKVQVGPV